MTYDDSVSMLERYGLDEASLDARLASVGVRPILYEQEIARAHERGFDNAHAFMAYRTKLRNDYASLLRRGGMRTPVSCLPFAGDIGMNLP